MKVSLQERSPSALFLQVLLEEQFKTFQIQVADWYIGYY